VVVGGGGGGGGGGGAQSVSSAAEARVLGRQNMAVRGIEYLEGGADEVGIETPGDVATVHRLQKAFPYRVPGISKQFSFCARPGGALSAAQKDACAQHFLWLLLRRSVNQAHCEEPGPCLPDPAQKNPQLDACLNPVLSDDQVRVCMCVCMCVCV
jgi:hypothetical protein